MEVKNIKNLKTGHIQMAECHLQSERSEESSIYSFFPRFKLITFSPAVYQPAVHFYIKQTNRRGIQVFPSNEPSWAACSAGFLLATDDRLWAESSTKCGCQVGSAVVNKQCSFGFMGYYFRFAGDTYNLSHCLFITIIMCSIHASW